MLISFKVKNVKSFKNESILPLIATSKIRELNSHEYRLFDRLSVIKNVGIFGANASGKTNIVQALKIAQEFILTGNVNITKFGFLDQLDQESLFSFILEIDRRLFLYEFSIVRNNTLTVSVEKENLVELKKDGSLSKIIYSKEENKFDFDNDKVLSVFYDRYNSVSALLFLTYLNAPERLIENNKTCETFKKIYSYFRNDLIILDSYKNVYSIIKENNIQTITERLMEYDTGLKEACFKEIELENIYQYIPHNTAQGLINTLLRLPGKSISITSESELLLLEKTDDTKILLKRLIIKHANIENSFTFGDESNGTKRLFFLVGLLLNGTSENKTFVVDEIEKGTHPNLIEKLILDFQLLNKENNAQLIFTSHLASLMDSSLRRDEIFFVDKDNFGSSNIYSLLDFKERTQTVGKKYLDGRFGAVPSLGINLDEGTD